ncbi:MAG: hypothetical protein AB7F86_07920 [Bdellovibrionales bacterium]
MSEDLPREFQKKFYLATAIFLVIFASFGFFDPPDEWFVPVGLFQLFPVPQPSFPWMAAIYFLTMAFTLVSAFTPYRLARVLTFIFYYYIFGIRYCYGFLSHIDAALTVALLVMAVASQKSDWQIRFIAFYWTLLLSLAGLHKLTVDGWGWASSDPIAQVVWRARLHANPQHLQPAPMLVSFMIESGLSKSLSWHVLLLELFAPLIFLSRTVHKLIFPQLLLILLAFQIVIDRHFIFSMAPLYLAAAYYRKRSFWDGSVE